MGQGLASGQGAGPGGAAAEMAMGFAMAQQMMNQPGGIAGSQGTPGIAGPAQAAAPATPAAAPAPAAAAPAAPAVELLTPAQVAQRLGVTEADVTASLESGDLKGKKIGTAWRITKAALDEFLAK